MSAPRLAAVVPLNYGIHMEHSLLLFDPHWENLLGLLECPQYYFRAAQTRWGQGERDPYVRWTLGDPATAILMPACDHHVISSAFHMAIRNLQKHCAYAKKVRSNEEAMRSKNAWQEHVMKHWQEDDDLRQGFFMVEFAIQTNVFTVYYMPPFDVKTGKVAPKKRYDKEFTEATISISEQDNLGFGGLHFDTYAEQDDFDPAGEPVINANGKPIRVKVATNERDRARFLMEMLESRVKLAELLSTRKADIANYKMVPEEHVIHFPQAENKVPPMKFFAPGSDKDEKKERDDFDLPNLVAEKVTADIPGMTCNYCHILKRAEDSYMLGNMINKIYPWNPPTYVPLDPEALAVVSVTTRKTARRNGHKSAANGHKVSRKN